jgi:hypothetical protein
LAGFELEKFGLPLPPASSGIIGSAILRKVLVANNLDPTIRETKDFGLAE